MIRFLYLLPALSALALLPACDEKQPASTSGSGETALQKAFPKRGDVETGEDGITRLKGESAPYSGAVVMRTKEWKPIYLATYKDGKLHGPELRYYEDGVTLMRWYDWFEGEKVRHREFYESGQIKIDAMMKDGEAFGKHRKWDEAGLLRFDGNFIENLLWHGHVTDLNAEGEVLWDAEFDNGRYVSGIYPEEAEADLIKNGLIDPETKMPTAR